VQQCRGLPGTPCFFSREIGIQTATELGHARTRLPSSLYAHRSRFYLTVDCGIPQAYGSSSTSVMSGPLAFRAAGRRKRFCRTTWASSSGWASLLSSSTLSLLLLSLV
jgi:hypothetical protein